MGPDMKESSRKASSMVRVNTKDLFNDLLILLFFYVLISKIFNNDSARYEGEFKEGMMHSQGKIDYLLKVLLNLMLLDA